MCTDDNDVVAKPLCPRLCNGNKHDTWYTVTEATQLLVATSMTHGTESLRIQYTLLVGWGETLSRAVTLVLLIQFQKCYDFLKA